MNSLRDEHFTKYSEYSEWKYFETENAALWLNFTIETNKFQNLSNINNVPPKSINNPECHPKRDPSQDSVCKEFAYNLHTQRRNLCFVRWICCALAVLICWIDWFCIVNILSPVWCAWCYHIHCDSVKKGNQNPNSIHHASRKKILPWKFLTEEHFDCNQCLKMVPIESDESNENSMEKKQHRKLGRKYSIFISNEMP